MGCDGLAARRAAGFAAALVMVACGASRGTDALPHNDVPVVTDTGDTGDTAEPAEVGEVLEPADVNEDTTRASDSADSNTLDVNADLSDCASALELVLGQHYDLELSDHDEMGEPTVVSGELIAVYDHSRWWKNPTGETTLALFAAERFADWPDDRSVLFVERSDIVRVTKSPLTAPPFRAWSHGRGIGIGVPLDGPAWVMAGHERHHLEENGFGDYAYDLGVAQSGGRRWSGDGLDLSDYFSWDIPATSPVDGFVVEVELDHPDMPVGLPPDLEAAENLVGLWLVGGYHVYILHYRQGSLPVDLAVGDFVAAGTPLGRIGNSGTSLEPHLHLALLYWDQERARYWSLPVDFHDVHVAAAPTGSEPRIRMAPLGGVWVSNEPF
jgi:hypothetical protein